MSEENQSVYDELVEKYDELVESASFEYHNDRVDRLGERVEELPEKIESLRERGYVFRSFLEDKAEKFADEYNDVREQVSEKIGSELDDLGNDINRPKPLLTNLERQIDNDRLFEKLSEQATEAVEELEEAVNTANDEVEEIYGTLEKDVESTYRQIRDIEWVLDQAEDTSFDFADGENVFLAAEAELVLTGKGRKDPDGILFLTNQRLVFEQRETTGKTLGMFGGKKEHEIEWETPLAAVETIDIENKGLFKGKDMLNFTMSAGDMTEVTVEVKGRADNKFWQKQIERMASGESDDERAIEADEDTKEALKSAPAECHICGATLPAAEAGAASVTCQYCGTTVQLA